MGGQVLTRCFQYVLDSRIKPGDVRLDQRWNDWENFASMSSDDERCVVVVTDGS
jgi:hypothetical protein